MVKELRRGRKEHLEVKNARYKQVQMGGTLISHHHQVEVSHASAWVESRFELSAALLKTIASPPPW